MKKFTGVPNERILENIKQLAELSARVVIRIPTIEGVNADEENIRKSGEFVKKYLPRAEMELLPYHKFGFGKYEALGIDLPDAAFGTPTKEKNGASEGDFCGKSAFLLRTSNKQKKQTSCHRWAHLPDGMSVFCFLPYI